MTLVLLVDDHPDTTDYLTVKLAEHGFQAEVARDGEEALALAGPRHAAIILDYHLPHIMGDIVFKQLRANPITQSIPIVFITADGARVIQHLLEPGKTICLQKALSTLVLVQALRDLIAGNSVQVA